MLQEIGSHSGGQVIVSATIDTTGALSSDLVDQVSDVCDRAESAEGSPIVVLQLTGAGSVEPWPGAVDIALVSKWEQVLRRLERLDD